MEGEGMKAGGEHARTAGFPSELIWYATAVVVLLASAVWVLGRDQRQADADAALVAQIAKDEEARIDKFEESDAVSSCVAAKVGPLLRDHKVKSITARSSAKQACWDVDSKGFVSARDCALPFDAVVTAANRWEGETKPQEFKLDYGFLFVESGGGFDVQVDEKVTVRVDPNVRQKLTPEGACAAISQRITEITKRVFP